MPIIIRTVFIIIIFIKIPTFDNANVAILNRELYRLRKKNSVIEHWVYFLCQVPNGKCLTLLGAVGCIYRP